MNNETTKLMFSSKSDDWATPDDFYEMLDEMYGFTLDPCCYKETAKCEKFFTPEEDGLSQPWTGEIVYMNPPYSDIKTWMKKACDEARFNRATVVCLIPSRTDTKWWHNEVNCYATEIFFVKGRLRFKGASASAPFPSAVVVFDGTRMENGRRKHPFPMVLQIGRNSKETEKLLKVI